MSSPALEAEKQARFEADQKAFERLDDRQQKIATLVASSAFGARQGTVAVGELFVKATEVTFNFLIRAPLGWAWDKTTQAAGVAADAPVRIAAAAARGGLALAQGALKLQSKWSDEEKQDQNDERIAQLEKKRENVTKWAQAKKEKADKEWKGKKRRFGNWLGRVGAFLEYNAAIGLYRGFKYVLDPRRKDGKPLLGNEKLNKAVGFVAALAMFGVLSYQISKIIVIGKILHYQLAKSLVTSTAPVWMKALQQTVLHPAITVGLTALKFVTLPVIAAARGRLKSTTLTQGIAYQYNRQLRDHREDKLKEAFNREAKYAPKEDDPKWKQFRRKAHAQAQKKSLSFVRGFFYHIVEKSSPEFYEVRFRHYQALKAEKLAQKQAKLAKQAPEAPRATFPANDLTPAFDAANNNLAKPANDTAAPAAPAPQAPKPPQAS